MHKMMAITELYRIFCEHPLVTTDTRNCPDGSIFFALKGERFNGNEFALQALEAGCAYAVVDDPTVKGDERLIHVDDVLHTLQLLAQHHRREMALPVLQITGTNGKTTTKELCATVLAEKFNVLSTQGNLNNHIGVPLTLLRLTSEHEVAVVETGANHPGEIADLSRLVNADCGLITNVGRAHLEGFGSFEGVIRTKGELYDHLRTQPHACVFLHADNPHLSAIAAGLTTFTYGTSGKGYEVEGEVIACQPMLVFRWRKQGCNWQEVATHLIGSYNLDNVLAAVAVGLHFGVSPEKISHAISHYIPKNNRSEFRRTEHNCLVVDAYNANPTSMKAALENFRQMEHPHKMMILGEMRELGTVSVEEHARIVQQIPMAGCEEVWLVGKEFAPFKDSYRYFSDVEAVKTFLQENPVNDRLVLIKGSNGTRLFQLPDLM